MKKTTPTRTSPRPCKGRSMTRTARNCSAPLQDPSVTQTAPNHSQNSSMCLRCLLVVGEEEQQNTTWKGNSAGSGLYVGQGERRPPQPSPRVPPHTHRRRSTAHLMKSFVRTAVVISRAAIDDASPQTDTPSFDYFAQPNLCLLLDKASARFHSTP